MNFLQDVYLDNLNVTFNSGGFLSAFGRKWAYVKHRFEQCKFYFVTCGTSVISIENTTYVAEKGDWFFIPSGTEHSYYNDPEKPFEKYWVHFDVAPEVKIFTKLNLPLVIKPQNFSHLKGVFSKMISLSNSTKLTDKLIVKSCLFSLLAEYVKQADIDGNAILVGYKNERLDTVLRYINENLGSDLSIEVLSKKYFAHPTHFIRAFKSKVGTTPAKYIRQKKVERVKLLLETTALSLQEIADALAFTDSAHLTRLFKNFYGTTPSNYKSLNKKDLT